MNRIRALVASSAAALPQVAVAAAKGAESPAAGGFLQMLMGLFAVLAVIAGAAWLVRRLGRLPSGIHGVVRVLGGMSLGARERVVLVQVGETQLLLGVAPGRVQTLHVFAQPVLVPSDRAPAGGGFPERLAALLRARGAR